jgi:hypothetical protein
MSDEYIMPGEPSTATKIADGIKVASATVSDAIETGKQPKACPWTSWLTPFVRRR